MPPTLTVLFASTRGVAGRMGAIIRLVRRTYPSGRNPKVVSNRLA